MTRSTRWDLHYFHKKSFLPCDFYVIEDIGNGKIAFLQYTKIFTISYLMWHQTYNVVVNNYCKLCHVLILVINDNDSYVIHSSMQELKNTFPCAKTEKVIKI